jgi:hypothetical protein
MPITYGYTWIKFNDIYIRPPNFQFLHKNRVLRSESQSFSQKQRRILRTYTAILIITQALCKVVVILFLKNSQSADCICTRSTLTYIISCQVIPNCYASIHLLQYSHSEQGFLYYYIFISGTHYGTASNSGILYRTAKVVIYNLCTAKLLPKSKKISYELNAKTLALSFTINVSHFHFIMGTWYRGEKNPATTRSYFFTECYQKDIRIQLSWHYLMLDKKSQNLMLN